VQRKPKPLVLYSTNTWLAYAISERYYRGLPMPGVRLTPARGRGRGMTRTCPRPPAHSRSTGCSTRRSAAATGTAQRLSRMRGAPSRRQQGVIGEPQEAEIRAAVRLAETRDFKPLLFVIPFSGVRGRVREVPVEGGPIHSPWSTSSSRSHARVSISSSFHDEDDIGVRDHPGFHQQRHRVGGSPQRTSRATSSSARRSLRPRSPDPPRERCRRNHRPDHRGDRDARAASDRLTR
jgi:hypothetical protein